MAADSTSNAERILKLWSGKRAGPGLGRIDPQGGGFDARRRAPQTGTRLSSLRNPPMTPPRLLSARTVIAGLLAAGLVGAGVAVAVSHATSPSLGVAGSAAATPSPSPG